MFAFWSFCLLPREQQFYIYINSLMQDSEYAKHCMKDYRWNAVPVLYDTAVLKQPLNGCIN